MTTQYGTSNGEQLVGNGCDNTILAGDGNDKVYGGGGDDWIQGDRGNDWVQGDSGADTLLGGSGADTVLGGTGNDWVQGDQGNDWLQGDDGEDTMLGGTGSDTLLGGIGADWLQGDDDNDWLQGDGDNDTLLGCDGDDTLLGGTGNDHLQGDLGHDWLQGDDGSDVLLGGDGSDTLLGGWGHDILHGDGGSDHLQGDGGDDTLRGGSGNDVLFGGQGNDRLEGGSGDDYLQGNEGADKLYGGLGNDTYIVDNAGDVVVESENEGVDLVQSSVNYTLVANVENLTLTGAALSGTGNTLNNTITGNSGHNLLNGDQGSDTLIGALGDDTLIGGLGNDSLIGGADNDVYQGFSGNFGVDTIWDISGTADRLSLTNYASSDVVSWQALDGDQVDGKLQDLRIEFANGNVILIKKYFNNASGDVVQSGAGAGLIESILFSDKTMAFADVKDLLSPAAPQPITGTPNADTLTGTEGNDTILGLAGNDLLQGQAGDDLLQAHEGDDTLNGGAGIDTLEGGQGNDVYIVDNAGDVVTEQANAGTDKVESSVNYTLTANVENLTLTGAALNGTGNELDNVIIGNANNNTLFGLAGNDRLDGGQGADTMFGGIGNDTYVVGSAFDVVTELANEGIDTVESSVSYILGNHVENLTLTGTVVDGTGNALDNVIIGNASHNSLQGLDGNDRLQDDIGNDLLNGGVGADTMSAGQGDDIYIVDNAGDVVVELSNQGVDTVVSSVDYTLAANVEDLTLTGTALNGTGNALANIINGNAQNNRLDGAAGADTLRGYAGNDTYIVDNAGDVITEAAGEGVDTVESSVDYALAANVENLTLKGAALNGTGNELDNTITGNANNNLLNGGAGADTMLGGLGNDTYIVDNIGDVVTELAGEGIDHVETSLNNYVLGANVENLTLTGAALNGTGNALDNVITGNNNNNLLLGLAGNDRLQGNAGDDTLDGGLGADTMIGGDGNDTYIVDDAGDVVSAALSAGIDTVVSSLEYYYLGNGSGVENLTLTGMALGGSGNELDNVITGNDNDNSLYGAQGNDTLIGGVGNDTLMGQEGNDVLIGGVGNDQYYVDSSTDVVTEGLNAGTDLVVSTADFTLGANIENLFLNGAALYGAGNELDNTVYGNAQNNTLLGNAGNDLLAGFAGADTLLGGEGDDTYAAFVGSEGGLGADVIQDDAGANDQLHLFNYQSSQVQEWKAVDANGDGKVEDLFIDLGNGDTITIRNFFDNTAASSANGGFGSGLIESIMFSDKTMTLDEIRALTGAQLLIGTTGDDALIGGIGNDTLMGQGGNDTLNGGAGNDLYVFTTSDGQSAISDASGVDTLDYSALTENLLVNLNTGTTAAPAPRAGEFKVNTILPGDQLTNHNQAMMPQALADGGYVTYWRSRENFVDNIYSQRFDQYGNAVGDAVKITDNLTNQYSPSIYMLPEGGRLVIWSAYDNFDTSDAGLETRMFAQAVDVNGQLSGSALQFSGIDAANHYIQQVKTLENGNTLVTWLAQDNFDTSDAANERRLYAQVFDAQGQAVDTARRLQGFDTQEQSIQYVHTLDNGGAIIVWSAQDANMDADSNSEFRLFAQMYDAEGHAVGTSLELSQVAAENQFLTNIRPLENGGLLLTWYAQDNFDTSDTETERRLYAQAFDAQGQAVGTTLQLSTQDLLGQQVHNVTVLKDGGAIITWYVIDNFDTSDAATETRLYSQFYNAQGQAVGGAHQLSVIEAESQFTQTITPLANGGALVSWYAYDNFDTSDTEYESRLYTQAFDAEGQPVGATHQLSTVDVYSQGLNTPTVLENGKVVLIWQTQDNYDTSDTARESRLYVQTFTADGQPIGSAAQLSTVDANSQYLQRVTLLENGGFLVSWQASDNFDTSDVASEARVYAQAFNANGEKVGAALQIPTTNSSESYVYDVKQLANGNTLMFVQSYDNFDTSDLNNEQRLYTQLFDANGQAIGSLNQLSDVDAHSQFIHGITVMGNGNILVTWQAQDNFNTSDAAFEYQLFSQVFNANGQPIDTVQQIGIVDAAGSLGSPNTTMLKNGGVIKVWQASDNFDTSDVNSEQRLYAQLFNANGQTTGNLLQLTGVDAQNQFISNVTALDNGGALIIWQSRDNFDTSDTAQESRLYIQAVDANGQLLYTTPLLLNAGSANQDQFIESVVVTPLSNGGYTVTWNAYHDRDGNGTYDYDVYARQIDQNGFTSDTDQSALLTTMPAGDIENVLGGSGHDQLIGNVLNNLIQGNAGKDTLQGGLGNDTLNGGAGNDFYLFSKGDGVDVVSDLDATAGNLDTLIFDGTVAKATVAIYMNSNGDLEIGYTDSTGDMITIQGQADAATGVERFELSDGSYMTEADVNQIIADMTAYAANEGVSLSSLNDVKNNQDLMNIVAAGWH